MSFLPSYSSGDARFHAADIIRAIPLLPRNAVLGLLWLYRRIISPTYGDVCRYYPSCSAYAVGAVQQHGAVIGIFRSVWRIVRCNPWSAGGIDDVPLRERFRYALTPRGFVVPFRKD